jgi:radical SAM protein with 4Fe4S-binding SPASM domain
MAENNSKFIPANPSYRELFKAKRILEWEKSRPEKWNEYRRKWEENPKNQKVEKFPIHLDIESTRECNLRCKMCPRTVKMEAGEKLYEGSMDFELYRKIIDEGAANGLYSIKLSYLGEPLMSRDIIRMVEYASKKGIIDVAMNTNGTLLTKDMSRKLMEAGATGIFVSFDSPDKKHFEEIRRGANFDKVVENIKSLIKIRNDLKSFFPIVRINTTIMKENEHEIPRLVEMWTPYADVIGASVYINPQQKDSRESDRRTEQQKRDDALRLERSKRFVCSVLYQRLFVHWDGKVGLCCTDIDANMSLGNAKTESIAKIWNGPIMKKIRELHAAGKWKDVSLCSRCDFPYQD